MLIYVPAAGESIRNNPVLEVPSGTTPGTVEVPDPKFCPAAQSCTGYSQYANCGSDQGFTGGPPLGLSLLTQNKISCTPCAGFEFHWPRKTGGRESYPGSGAGGTKSPAEYLSMAYCMNSCHIGAMINAAIFFCIGELSLLPAHAPTEIP